MPRQMLTLEGETRLAAWHALGVSAGVIGGAEAALAASVFDFELQSTRLRSLDALRERRSPVVFAARIANLSGDSYQIVRGRRVSLTDEARSVIFHAIERLSQPPRAPVTQSIPDMGEEGWHPPQEPPVAGDILPDPTAVRTDTPLPTLTSMIGALATTIPPADDLMSPPEVGRAEEEEMRARLEEMRARVQAATPVDPAEADAMNRTQLEEVRTRLQEIADATAPRQLSLLPEQTVPYALRTVPVAQLRYRASEPSNELLRSIEAFGVFQPIVVIDRGPNVVTDRGEAQRPQYQVVAGRRRVTAVSRLGRVVIPALVFPVGTSRTVAAAVALMENGLRAENPLTDMAAIESLMMEGATLEQISDELGLGRSVVRARLQLRQLVPALRELLERGAITLAMATEIARYCSIAVQHEILDHWNRTHTLTIADVRRLAGRNNPTTEQTTLPLPSLAPGTTLMAHHATAVTVTPELVEITVSNGVVFRVRELRIVDMGAPHRALAAAEEVAGASYARQEVTFAAPQDARTRPTRLPPAPSDDRELSEAEVAALQAEMERTPAAPGEESWSRVGHLLNLALACVPVAPDGPVEDLYAAISTVITHVAAMSAEEANVDTTLALPVVGAARPRAQRALRTRR